jgi:hypothetical protein
MIEKELAELIKTKIEQLVKLKSIDSHYQKTVELLNDKQREIQETTVQLAKELKDVETLENLSIKSIFHNVLGNKEEQLDRERQEYLEMSLKLKELVKSIELLEYEESLLKQKVENTESVKAELETLKKQREKLILSIPHQLKASLVGLNNNIDKNHQILSEIEEAHKAGNTAAISINTVIKHLNQALKWGNFDMSNQGRHYDRMKHGELDRASAESTRSQYFLSVFQKELADIGLTFPYSRLNIEGGGSFTGIFFDNLITDWIMQNKIKNTLNGVDAIYDKLALVLKSLDNEKNKIKHNLTVLQSEKSKLLES